MALTARLLSWLLVIAGLASVVIGAAILHPAAGWLVAGAGLATVGLMLVDVDSPIRVELHKR